jgi:hypothetical protein
MRHIPFAASAAISFVGFYLMNAFRHARASTAALAGIALLGTTMLAHADINDYAFQLVDPTVKAGPDRIITVRLVNKKTGKPVPDAVIVATRLDMAPDGMADMATTIAIQPGGEPGTYRFKAKVTMAGGWRLSLAAKVQGEESTVDDKLVIKAEE